MEYCGCAIWSNHCRAQQPCTTGTSIFNQNDGGLHYLKRAKSRKAPQNDILTATPVVNMVMWDESQMYLKPGEQISIDQLLAGLIVMSANDAAVSLGEKFQVTSPTLWHV